MLNPPDGVRPGSPWWRAANEGLLRDKVEAVLLSAAGERAASTPSVRLWLEFLDRPSARGWYRAHNASILRGYLRHERLARHEVTLERFMINVALLRVVLAHAMVAAPRLAAGGFGWIGSLLGDPRMPTVRMFVDLRRAYPATYPLDGFVLEDVIAAERWPAKVLDYGVIAPRIPELFAFAAAAVGEPGVLTMVDGGVPCYALPAGMRSTWLLGDTDLLRWVARATGARGGYDRVFRS